MILFSVAHHAQRQGVFYKGRSVFELSLLWLEELKILLDPKYCLFVPHMTGEYKIEFINSHHHKTDLAIELQFNNDKKANDKNELYYGEGSETQYDPRDKRSKEAAFIYQDEIGSVFTPDRGIKKGGGHFIKKVKSPSIIIIPEYIHHQVKIDFNKTTALMCILKATQIIINRWSL